VDRAQFEPLTIAFVCPLLDSTPWKVENGKIKCLGGCGLIEYRCGVIRGKFGLRSHQGNMCNGAWHRKCFKQHTLDRYHVLTRQDLEDSLVDESTCEDDDPLRFKEARDGDDLIAPFQCVECHFVNI